MIYLLIIAFAVYFLYTLNFAIEFNRTKTYSVTNKNYYTISFIWIIPFFWMMIVKIVTRPTPGSDKFNKTKQDSGFYESGIGIYGHEDGHHHHSDGGHGADGDD